MFKSRTGISVSTQTSGRSDTSTTQSIDAHICSDALLLLLPDPVTCFADSSYEQLQTFVLEKDASIILLDWITSGRMSRGEEWAFSSYYSLNEVWLQGVRVARDALLLETSPLDALERGIEVRMRSYACYATVILCGPRVQRIISDVLARYDAISVFQQSSPMSLVWSASRVNSGCVIIRVAGQETETVKLWLKDTLNGAESLIGSDAYSKAFI